MHIDLLLPMQAADQQESLAAQAGHLIPQVNLLEIVIALLSAVAMIAPAR